MNYITVVRGKLKGDPKVAEAFGALFEGMPDISVWAESDWASF